jgi:hypothetical protein
VGANYLEIAAPPEAHEVLIKAKDHLLYEPVKDFALQRLVRNDVWVKLPAEQSADKPTLFGLFTFGITTPREKIPSALPTKGASIDLSSSLFSSLIDLMCVLPMGIGDFLQHPTGKGFDPDDVLAAVQILVAGGIARPMRGRYDGLLRAAIAYPRWSNGFTAYLKEYPIRQIFCSSGLAHRWRGGFPLRAGSLGVTGSQPRGLGECFRGFAAGT